MFFFCRLNDNNLRKEGEHNHNNAPYNSWSSRGTYRHGDDGKHPFFTPDQKEIMFGKD